MTRSTPLRLAMVLAILGYAGYAAHAAAQAEQKAQNLKVLAPDIPRQQLLAIMNGFTRALGVRCNYCHVGEEGQPHRPEDFAKDDKPAKNKARIMMRMTQDLNDKYLTQIEGRATPPVHVQCVTCHHGAPQPRTLQDVLQTSYDQGGIDSTVARYQALRDRYYGRFTYDFGEVPLADVAGHVREAGHPEDAARLLALNVEMNPKSAFARRQDASATLFMAFAGGNADSGRAAYRRLSDKYGPTVVSEEVVNNVGYQLLGSGKTAPAVAAFQLEVSEHPDSGNAYDSLGEAYAAAGDRKHAIEAYTKALELDPKNDNARQKLGELKSSKKGSKTKKK